MTSLCLSCFLTGRSSCLIDHFLMTGWKNLCLSLYDLLTYRTMDSCRLSCGFTGRSYRLVNNFYMVSFRNFFCLCFLAFCTGKLLCSFFSTSWSLKNLSFFPLMPVCRDHCLELKDLSTYRAMFSLSFSCCFAGSCYCLINYFFMTSCGDYILISKKLLAGTAVYYCVSLFFTGRRFCHDLYFLMTKGWNLFLHFKYFSTGLAMTPLSFPCCFASWFYCCICYCIMSKSRDFFLGSYYFSTGFTVAAFRFSRSFTGSLYCFINDLLMSCCRSFLCFCFLTSCTGIYLLTIFCAAYFAENFP